MPLFRRFKWLICSALCTLHFAADAARVRSVAVSGDQTIVAPRWMYDSTSVIKGPPVVQQLVEIRRQQITGDYTGCEVLARKAATASKGVETWLVLARLNCASAAARSDLKAAPTLAAVLQVVEEHPRWLLFGPQVETMRKAYVDGLLLWFDAQMRGNRKDAWKTYDQLQLARLWLSSEQKAQALRTAGELAFVEQNLLLALDMFSRSLDEKDSPEVRKRMDSLKVTFTGRKSEEKAEKKEKTEAAITGAAEPAPNETQGEEVQIMARMRQAIDGGDLLSAVEDGVEIIKKYPGSSAAKWSADRVLEIYLSLGSHSEANFENLRQRAVSFMLKADGGRLYRWGMNAAAKGFYADALSMAEASLSKMDGHPDSTKILDLAAQAALFSGAYRKAENLFTQLVRGHSGSDEATQALFRLGLLKFRDKKWGAASAYFERLLALPSIGDWEYLALHWHWRAQQKLKSVTADDTAARLVNKYPLTYYGLRARAELNQGHLSWPKTPAPTVKTDLWMSESQSQGWERLQILLKAGWFDEAQAELAALPPPQSAEDKLVRARLLAAAFDHYHAVKMFNDIWRNRPEFLQRDFLRQAFPLEFSQTVDKEARVSALDPFLLHGLIRQESSFRSSVTSSAGAVGLMQVLPTTAQDILSGQKTKSQGNMAEELTKADVNIKIGTIYLSRLLKVFKGNVPLSLAAYNAGLARLRRWLNARPDLGAVEARLSSAPEDELWIDELPWDETSQYVKAILRNLLLYRMLDKGEIELQDPVWRVLKN